LYQTSPTRRSYSPDNPRELTMRRFTAFASFLAFNHSRQCRTVLPRWILLIMVVSPANHSETYWEPFFDGLIHSDQLPGNQQ
jgi:hypothetical protein